MTGVDKLLSKHAGDIKYYRRQPSRKGCICYEILILNKYDQNWYTDGSKTEKGVGAAI